MKKKDIFEFETFIYTNYIWIILSILFLFVTIVLTPYYLTIEYFWGWDVIGDFRYPLGKKLHIFAMVIIPFMHIFTKTIIYLLKKRVTVIFTDDNKLIIQKKHSKKNLLIIDNIKDFSIELIDRKMLNTASETYIIKFKNNQNQKVNLSCPKKIFNNVTEFKMLQEFLKVRYNTEAFSVNSTSSIKSKIKLVQTLITKTNKHEISEKEFNKISLKDK